MLGCQKPRLRCVPADGVSHPDLEAALELVEAAGLHLDEWQQDVLRGSLLQRGRKWAAFEVGLVCPRQNGKNSIIEARELAGLFVLGERLIIHSAHLADTAKEAFRRLEELIDANDWLRREVKHIWRTNGHEAIELTNGSRIRFRTRTKGGGRGFSGDLVVFDEAMILPETSHAAILPVVSARPNPQAWYTGSAVDRAVHEDGFVLARIRRRGVAGDDQSLAFFEWSIDHENPSSVPLETMKDEAAAAQANPALNVRIGWEHVQNEMRSMDGRTFAVERLGVGDWPVADGDGGVINVDLWNSLIDGQSEPTGVVGVAFDVSPDRSSASIGIAGRREDGLWHLEVAKRARGTAWLVDDLLALTVKNPNVGVIYDGYGPAGSLVHELEEKGVEAVAVSAKEHSQACGQLFDGVEQAKCRHLGQPELLNAIRGAAKRPLGDAWAWSRKSSAIDISPLVSVTLALWLATEAVEEAPVAWAAFV